MGGRSVHDPPKWTTEVRINSPLRGDILGDEQHWLLETAEVLARDLTWEGRRRVAGRLLRLATTGLGMREIGDLTPETTSCEMQSTMGDRYGGIANRVRRLHKGRYARRNVPTEKDWGLRAGRVRTKSDPKFEWASETDPTLRKWQELCASWTAEYPAKSTAIRSGESFLNYLAAHPDITRDARIYCTRGYQAQPSFNEWVKTRNRNRRGRWDTTRGVQILIEWVLDERLSEKDEEGQPRRPTELWNPIRVEARKAQGVQTHRPALPMRYIREMIQILTEKDYAWAKTLKTEWMERYDAQTDSWEKIWIPITTTVMLLKLQLPLRTSQARMLDSGEGDEERYLNGQWVRNARCAERGRREGALRKYVDASTGEVFTGFYINTNKTQDRWKGSAPHGYELPWQHDEAIRAVVHLVQWQETYNPIQQATPWNEVTDPVLVRIGRAGEYARTGGSWFLTRDPRNNDPRQPIRDARISTLWVKLQAELERRMSERGEGRAIGGRSELVTERYPSTGNPTKGAYDLHSLRVTLITALATEGGVPLGILSKCIAGHSSVMMTLYYVKTSPRRLNETLREAQARIAQSEEHEMLRLLETADEAGRRKGTVWNSPTGPDTVSKEHRSAWLIGETGICPVGGNLCEIGGPKLTKNPQLSDYAPTPGGEANCTRCRFFVTGPAFLGGLVAQFNSTTLKLQERAQEHKASTKRLKELEDQAANPELDEGGRRRAFNEVLKEEKTLQRAAIATDEQAQNLHAIYRLTERCKEIARESSEEGKGMSLVLGGTVADLETAVEETTEFELANKICEDATVYPGTDHRSANLIRARVLDAMLARAGKPAVFASLTEEEALRIGNEFTKLLKLRHGQHGMEALAAGSRILSEAGIKEAMQVAKSRGETAPTRRIEGPKLTHDGQAA